MGYTSTQNKFYCFGHIKLSVVLFFFLAISQFSWAQTITIDDLLNISNSEKKFENLLKKRGYICHGISTTNDSTVYIYSKRKPTDSISRQFFKYQIHNEELIAFQTTSEEENASMKEKLGMEGFKYPSDKMTAVEASVFQKANTIVSFSQKPGDSLTLYTCYIKHQRLPKAKDIHFADDLLQLGSHEFLCEVFGSQNVKKDLFFFSENKIAPCSILFPNTKMEAVFIWQDGVNYRKILALRVGGDPQTKSSISYERSIEQNVWQFREGLYIGMSLYELQKLNSVTSSNSNYGRYISQGNDHGGLSNLGLILSCLNCGDSKYYRADFSALSDAASQDRKIYLSTIILFNKEK